MFLDIPLRSGLNQIDPLINTKRIVNQKRYTNLTHAALAAQCVSTLLLDPRLKSSFPKLLLSADVAKHVRVSAQPDVGHIAGMFAGKNPIESGPVSRKAIYSRSAALARATKSRTLSGSLRPGAVSTPEATSTPQGRKVSIASATFSGLSPPAAIRRFRASAL